MSNSESFSSSTSNSVAAKPTSNNNTTVKNNNTLAKSMVNADIQPISRSDNRVPDFSQPSYKVSADRIAATPKMSQMEDRRILNKGIRVKGMEI